MQGNYRSVNTELIDKTKSTSQEEHIEKPQPCFKTNKEIEIFTSDKLNNDSINNDNINPEPLKEIIKETSNEQVEANETKRDEENHNLELQVNLNQIEKKNNSNDDELLKEIEQKLKAFSTSSVEQPLKEPEGQSVVQEVPVEEPPVEAKSTSVSEAEAQEITYDDLCEMIGNSSLTDETQSSLKASLNSESINVKDIKEIISAVGAETLKKEHDLVCSILKFLMKKGIDAKQRLDFRGLIKTLIDEKVLRMQDHNLVYESLVVISNQIQSTDSIVIIQIANSAIEQSILNQEECVGIISNSVMNAKPYGLIIAGIVRQNISLSRDIAKNVIQQISPEKLLNVIYTVRNTLTRINNICNTDKKAEVTNCFVTEFLPTLLRRIQTLVANNSVGEEVKKSILFQFTFLFDVAILNDLFAQNKPAAEDLFNSLVPYLNQYQLNVSQTLSWIDHLKDDAEKFGITLQETM